MHSTAHSRNSFGDDMAPPLALLRRERDRSLSHERLIVNRCRRLPTISALLWKTGGSSVASVAFLRFKFSLSRRSEGASKDAHHLPSPRGIPIRWRRIVL